MSIKTQIQTTKQDIEVTFPKLMISENGAVVLFIRAKCGTVLVKSPAKFEADVATYHENFNMSKFQIFTGDLILTND